MDNPKNQKEKSNKSKKQFKMDWTFTLTILAVVAAWVPFLYERFNPVLIKGKLISQYDNIGEFRKEPKALFLFKLSVVSLNQSFALKDIDVDIKYENNGQTHNSAVNQRQTFFTLDNKLRKLSVPESLFLIALSLFSKNYSASIASEFVSSGL